MIRRLLVPLLGSGLLLAATAGSAFAKCEMPEPKPAFCSQVVASLNAGGGMLQAGTRESVDIFVSKGEQPFAAKSVVLFLIRDLDGSRLEAKATATATSEPGRWTAEALVPEEGSWMVSVQVVDDNGETYQIPVSTEWGMVLLALAPATPPATPASPVLPIGLAIAGLAAAALAGQVIRDRSRRRTAATGVASGSAATAHRA